METVASALSRTTRPLGAHAQPCDPNRNLDPQGFDPLRDWRDHVAVQSFGSHDEGQEAFRPSQSALIARDVDSRYVGPSKPPIAAVLDHADHPSVVYTWFQTEPDPLARAQKLPRTDPWQALG